MTMNPALSRGARARLLMATLIAITAPTLAPAKDKPAPAAKYVGHLLSFMRSKFIIQIDAFTPEALAEEVALVGKDGNANAIREALGKQDCGFMKMGETGYRIAFARRIPEADGLRIVLLFRNVLNGVAPAGHRTFAAPPMAAAEVWIPTTGAGRAVITGIAEVTFQSEYDIRITDWGERAIECHDLQPAER